MAFDFIGDVHGQYYKLVELLREMGYELLLDTWYCPGRTAMFVGNLIDYGPDQIQTVDLVRRMEGIGAARCVLGEREFKAISWATPDPDQPGKFLRDHDEPGNREQHRAFLSEVENTPRHAEFVAWFRQLPMWLNFGDFRVIHACWHEPWVEMLNHSGRPHQRLSENLIVYGNKQGHWAHAALNTILNGPQVSLPAGATFQVDDGKERGEIQVRWWEPLLSNYRQAAICPQESLMDIPATPLPSEWRFPRDPGKLAFFGHYGFTGIPEVISRRYACLDYCAAKDGPLVAYRWDGERELESDKLFWV